MTLRPPAIRRRLRRHALILAATLIAPGAMTGPASAAYPSLFGTHEIHSDNLKLFPKWRGTMDRYGEEQTGCADPLCDKIFWAQLLQDLAGLDRMTQIERVNRVMNERIYVLDPINWGVPDYWATPFQFLRKNGDCEDYAIAKFMALRALGFENEEMRIVVLNDLNLGIAHAILVVYVDGNALVLDNQIRSVVPADTIRHYQPVYSVNEVGWWLHRQ